MKIENKRDLIRVLRQCDENVFLAQMKIHELKQSVDSLTNVDHEFHNCLTDLDSIHALVASHNDVAFAIRGVLHRAIAKLGGDW